LLAETNNAINTNCFFCQHNQRFENWTAFSDIIGLDLMRKLTITFGGKDVTIAFPAELTPFIKRLFSTLICAETTAKPLFTINHDPEDGRLTILKDHAVIAEASSADQCAQLLEKVVLGAIIKSIDSGVALLGAAVAHQQKGIFIPALPGDGKALMVAWLLANGGQYLTDRLVVFPGGSQGLRAFTSTLKIDRRIAPLVLPLIGLDAAAPELINTPEKLLVPPTALPAVPGNQAIVPGLMVFCDVRRTHKFSATVLTPAQAVARLMGCVANSHRLNRLGLPVISALARKVPALDILFDSIEQLDKNMGTLLGLVHKGDLNPKAWIQLNRMFQVERNAPTPSETLQAGTTVASPVPAPTPTHSKRKLAIGMPTYDDFDGVYFSIQALRLYHPEVTDHTEIVVIDNNPSGPAGTHLKALDKKIKYYRYIPVAEKMGAAAAKNAVFEHTNADYVLCMDCHVLIEPGAISKLLTYFDTHPDCRNLLQGPLLDDSLTTVLTHFNPQWSTGMYGVWGHDDRGADPDNEPFEIPMQGMGLFACKKANWPGFNSHFRGFGGEEGYIHEKFRQAGGKAMCLPFLRWTHRFARPMGVPYPINWEDRILNYLVGFSELGLETDSIIEHFTAHLGEGATAIRDAVKEAEKVLGKPPVSGKGFNGIIQEKYDQLRRQPSDINEHLSTIKGFSKDRNHVITLGVGSAVSTWAILAGSPKKITSYDIAKHKNVDLAKRCAAAQGIDFTFIEADTRRIDIVPADVMLVDTLHTYKQLYTELVKHADKISHSILIHGTVSFGETDMPDIYNLDPKLFVDCPDKQGLIAAIDDFIEAHPQWDKHQHFTNNNGLLVLKRVGTGSSLPFISCICPTYKRPDLLRNALACFLAQDYPKKRCELVILDDAGQFEPQEKDNWKLISTKERYPNLPTKYNDLIQRARGEIIATWEDDDIFLPWMLKDVAECHLRGGHEFYVTKTVWTNCDQPFGEVQLEDATGRFHSSWRFTKALYYRAGGYPVSGALAFDLEFGRIMEQAARGKQYYGKENLPGYVYRWGNGYWHGSQQGGGEGYSSLWEHIGTLPAPKQGKLEPKFDKETLKIFQHISKFVTDSL
jgi:glycosyltransferase involved in cell wall biosynthesis